MTVTIIINIIITIIITIIIIITVNIITIIIIIIIYAIIIYQKRGRLTCTTYSRYALDSLNTNIMDNELWVSVDF